ncbi:MAG: hypothetical protein HRT57_09585 [Crocinitomicaceae bacterium]|nr:hypothetical protein [Crocinitomicaceae bacterium]
MNKLPNHILVDSNRVYWHHMEHPYGHRMNDLNDIFAKSFNFYPTSSNLDSLSGFNYCQCHNEYANLDELQGDWIFDASIDIRLDSTKRLWGRVMNSGFNVKEGMEITLTKDTTWGNGNSYSHSVSRSLSLAEIKYYWNYKYFPEYGTRSEGFPLRINKENYTEDFITKTDALTKNHLPYKTYSIYIKELRHLQVISIEGHGTYCESGNKFSRMRRR